MPDISVGSYMVQITDEIRDESCNGVKTTVQDDHSQNLSIAGISV